MNTERHSREISLQVTIGGIYKHYSGKMYKVLSIAQYSENPDSLMVIYQAEYDCSQYGKNSIWCRPYSMFTELVTIDGVQRPRFLKIENNHTEDTYHHSIKYIIRNSQSHLLILKSQESGWWDLPGGRVHMHESFENAGKREVQEETGIVSLSQISYITSFPSIIRLSLNKYQNVGIIYSFYTAYTNHTYITLSEEHSAYAWVSLEKGYTHLQEFFGPSIESVFKKIERDKNS